MKICFNFWLPAIVFHGFIVVSLTCTVMLKGNFFLQAFIWFHNQSKLNFSYSITILQPKVLCAFSGKAYHIKLQKTASYGGLL